MYIRIWEKVDLEMVSKHLVVAGELSGDCSNCRELGIDFAAAKICPKCRTEFKYLAIRRNNSSDGGLIKRLKDKRPDLIFIDYNDFKEALDKLKAKRFFSK